jgi:hypothetical protein
MGDYLSSLLNRNQGQPVVVRPRPITLFEPSIATGSLATEQHATSEATEEKPGYDEATPGAWPTALPAARGREALRSSVPETRNSRDVRHHADGLPSAASQPTRQDPSSKLIASQVVGMSSEPPPVRPARNPIDPAPSQSPLQEAPTQLSPGEGALPSATAPRQTGSAADQGRPTLEAVPRPHPIEPGSVADTPLMPDISPPGPRSPSEVAIARPHITPRIESAGGSPHPTPPTPEPAPTVKVTIGRVEVRAITPAPPTSRPKPAKTGPTLSLDDYLKRRSGGG